MPTPTPLRYRLDPHDLAGHRCRVTLEIPTPNAQGQQLTMPAWIPGSYLLREFGRQIESLEAYDQQQRQLSVTKLDRNTWQVEPCDGPITITTVVYCFDLSVRGAHLDDSHGFFNGTSVFLGVVGQEQTPCLLELLPPRDRATATNTPWSVHTSLPEAHGEDGAATRYGFGLYRAPNYDALLDHPIEMGTPQVVSFTAHGAQHDMVFTGVAPGVDLARLAADTQRICEAQIALFEPDSKQAPFLDSADRYVFMTLITADGYGGLEHRASTALITSRRDLPVIGQAELSEGYRTFLGLISHEYFHTWNVKRIKPAAFAPYDLTQENYTRLLWIFEGFTSYYDDLMLLRSGVIQPSDYLALLGRTISQVHRSSGRTKQSVAESSFDAWTRYYRQDENSPNALVSYYTKGSLMALGLDLYIRQASKGDKSLDQVMRLLWQRYGRDFYLTDAPQGVAEDEFSALVQEATGIDVTAFVAQYAYGTDDVPLDTLLAAAGYQLHWKASSKLPVFIDWRTRAQGTEVHIATIYENGNAHRAGLSAGDVVVALDGLRVTASNLDALLQRYQPGQTVTLHVFRGDQLRHFPLELVEPPQQDCVVQAISH